ncbi:hypothetical protein [Alysiella crassa]|uniref:Uncharacterized protein n=2 Tax=Alysiella crassa TaxID=153491 RepID=A0A376BN80_9NEIS|nr:hypothetical protein [Alysiella crassa]SSY71179.1 Uncharacterised protein [Alysiella crassa]
MKKTIFLLLVLICSSSVFANNDLKNKPLSYEHGLELYNEEARHYQVSAILYLCAIEYLRRAHPEFPLTAENFQRVRQSVDEFMTLQNTVPNSPANFYANIYADYFTEADWQQFEQEKRAIDGVLRKKLILHHQQLRERMIKEWLLENFVLSVFLQILDNDLGLPKRY